VPCLLLQIGLGGGSGGGERVDEGESRVGGVSLHSESGWGAKERVSVLGFGHGWICRNVERGREGFWSFDCFEIRHVIVSRQSFH